MHGTMNIKIVVVICNKTDISLIRTAWCPNKGQWVYIWCQWFYIFITLCLPCHTNR